MKPVFIMHYMAVFIMHNILKQHYNMLYHLVNNHNNITIHYSKIMQCKIVLVTFITQDKACI